MLSFNGVVKRRPDVLQTIRLCIQGYQRLTSFVDGGTRLEQTPFVRLHSSIATNTNEGQKRLVKTLYRELLSWCKTTSDEIPLASFIPPPVTLEAPLLDKIILEQLSQENGDNRNLFPQNAVFEPNQLFVPILNVKDLQTLIRALFRLNAMHASEEVEQYRIRAALDTVKLLNTLTTSLKDLQEKRRQHLDRNGVLFRVGQVVQHKEENWRVVIVGWERRAAVRKKKKRSHSSVGLSAEEVWYTVIVDEADFSDMIWDEGQRLFGKSKLPSVRQSDLELVKDKLLCRLKNNKISDYFRRFDVGSNCFIPNDILSYKYPRDNLSSSVKAPLEPSFEGRAQLARYVVIGVQSFASHLQEVILQKLSGSSVQGGSFLASIQRQLALLSGGTILQKDRKWSKDESPQHAATLHLTSLYTLLTDVTQFLWRQRFRSEVQFPVGSLVKHKVFNYRAVVIGWDPKPRIDVSSWDGLVHIENPMELPFYQVAVDSSDCVKAFGKPGRFRYVCQENLEGCSDSWKSITVELPDDWRRLPNGQYAPPLEEALKHDVSIDHDALTVSCLSLIQEEAANIFSAAQTRNFIPTTPALFKSAALSLSHDALFSLLQSAESTEEATAIENIIEQSWAAHANTQLYFRLFEGIDDFNRGQLKKAHGILQQLVEDDPMYAEAWNWLSRCEHMLGYLEKSLESAERVLQIEPNHYIALSRMGVIATQEGYVRKAAAIFRKSLELHPWLPTASQLGSCNLFVKTFGQDDQGSEEGTAPYEIK